MPARVVRRIPVTLSLDVSDRLDVIASEHHTTTARLLGQLGRAIVDDNLIDLAQRLSAPTPASKPRPASHHQPPRDDNEPPDWARPPRTWTGAR